MNIIIDYYDELKNNVDISAERLLSVDCSELEQLKISSTRQNILQKIDEVLLLNLNFLQSKKPFVNHDEYFGPKFIFWLNRNDQKFGQFLLTNKYVTKTVRDKLNKCSTEIDLSFSNQLEKVIIEILSSSERKSEIIDLTKIENNVIHSLKLCISKPMSKDGFTILQDWIDIDKLVVLSIEIDGIIPNKSFSLLNKLKTLHIMAMTETTFEPDCFHGLDNLNDLILTRLLNQSFYLTNNNLSSLKKLNFFESELGLLNLEKFINLEYLTIHFCYVKLSNLIQFKNLLSLTFYISNLTLLDDNLFNNFKSLVYLNIHFSTIEGSFNTNSLNTLQNLEVLYLYKNSCSIEYEELNLPKLKYLTITSETIPAFKHLNLSYLGILNLKHFNKNKLVCQKDLLALSISISHQSYKNLNDADLCHLEKLVFLSIENCDFFEYLDRKMYVNSELSKWFKNKFGCYFLHTDFNSVQWSIYYHFNELIEHKIPLSNEAKEVLMNNIFDDEYSDKKLGIKLQRI